tara:strand:+ start:9318 stop:9842 length:525 start_codon:yes stop_codon:yes gene_type:complete
MNSLRWTIAIHEAAHAVACIALGGRVSSVEVLSDCGGCNMIELSPDRLAFAAAAGPRAEYLADEFDPPVMPEPITAKMPEAIADDSTEPAPATTLPMEPIAVHDDERIALWAISGHFGEPDSWARRVRFAYHVADQLITANRDHVVEIAKALYLRSRLNANDIEQITEPMELVA